jgi:hypothetical protein
MMKFGRSHFIAIGIALLSRFAAAQPAPAQYPTPPPVQGAPYPQQMPAPRAAQPQGYPPPAQGAPAQPALDPQQAQGTKARGYPQSYFPQQGGPLQQQPLYGGSIPLGGGEPGAQSPSNSAGVNDVGEKREADRGHHGQVHFRAEFLTGYRMLYRYQPSPRCAPYDASKSANDQQKLCGYGAAPAVGMAVGFAVVDFFEPFAFVRLGLANEAAETNQGRLLQAGFGARFYAMADSPFKMFFSPWLGVDATTGPLETIGAGAPGSPGYDDALAKVKPGSYKTDLLAHFSLGPQYDFSRGFGVYLSGGLTVQMVRYFGAAADLSIGFQARAP